MLSIDEVIPEKDLVSKTLNSLPPSYLTFQTSLTLSLRANPDPLYFEELVALLLQEDQSRKNKSLQVDGMDHALVEQNKNKGKESAHYSKSSAGQSSEKSKGDSDKSKKKGKWHYCKKPGHYISECKKRIAKEKKKESSLVVSASGDSSTAKEESANFVQDSYAFVVCYIFLLTVLTRHK
ncbi:hypothetical protein DD598_28810 [Enterobacter cloacae complex sp. 2DZ2F16B1]|nr:hypothetical protein DD598_28810 [Enterobacter cloacae complex sp. 2DZ2F16B1]